MVQLHNALVVAVSALVVAASVGCGEKPAPEPQTAASKKSEAVAEPADKPTPPSKDSIPNTPTASGVKIADEIAKACGITDPEAYFAFDSAHVRPEDGKPLDKLADCFEKGPMKGHKMKIVGHADPRGDSDYNVQLGLSRADSVAKYLFQKGLDKGKAATSSRGSMDAKGTDEASWALDRRVDVMLGD
jgi:peptidoglycan-associated lipoprotein